MNGRPFRWTDLEDDPDGFIEVEIELSGPRVVAELLEETGAKSLEEALFVERVEAPCFCEKCRHIRERVRRKEERRHGRRSDRQPRKP